METPRLESHVPELLASGLDHPEAVCWSAETGTVIAGGEAGQIYSMDLDGSLAVTLEIDGADLLGLALDADQNIYACDAAGGRILRITPELEVNGYGPRMTYPNYPAFDAEGTLWASDSGHWGSGDGRLVGISPSGAERTIDVGPFEFSNGVAVRGRDLFLVTSGDPAVWVVDLDREEAEVIVRLPKTVPDGVALDIEGGVWISCFQPNRIYRLDPDGTLETVLDDWSGEDFLSPTNIAFAGPELKTVVMASLCGRTVKRFDSWVAGRSLEYPSRVNH